MCCNSKRIEDFSPKFSVTEAEIVEDEVEPQILMGHVANSASESDSTDGSTDKDTNNDSSDDDIPSKRLRM